MSKSTGQLEYMSSLREQYMPSLREECMSGGLSSMSSVGSLASACSWSSGCSLETIRPQPPNLQLSQQARPADLLDRRFRLRGRHSPPQGKLYLVQERLQFLGARAERWSPRKQARNGLQASRERPIRLGTAAPDGIPWQQVLQSESPEVDSVPQGTRRRA